MYSWLLDANSCHSQWTYYAYYTRSYEDISHQTWHLPNTSKKEQHKQTNNYCKLPNSNTRCPDSMKGKDSHLVLVLVMDADAAAAAFPSCHFHQLLHKHRRVNIAIDTESLHFLISVWAPWTEGLASGWRGKPGTANRWWLGDLLWKDAHSICRWGWGGGFKTDCTGHCTQEHKLCTQEH